MIRQIKSEIMKLLTVRSTYYTLLACLAIMIFFAFYIEGFHSTKAITDPNKLASEVTSAVSALILLITLVGVLLLTHEYRYNTIMYTLTANNSRWKALAAKAVAVSLFAVAVTLLFGALSPIFAYAGIHLKGLAMVHQNIPYVDLLWRSAFYGWGYAMLGFILAAIIRNQVGAIIVLLFVPTTVESLLSLLLKGNVKYLPFHALGGVLGDMGQPTGQALLASGKGALVVTAYVIVGMLVAFYLFQRRDAN
jgi:ABC-2 type transport system permease protein